MAFISDIHGNLEALLAVFKDINNNRSNIDFIYCNGDIVGYYPNPLECIALVQKRCEQVILGNHDEVVTSKNFNEHVTWFNYIAAEALIWTKNRLSKPDAANQLHYLEALKTQQDLSIENRKVLLAHGTPEEKWEYFLKDPFIGDFSSKQEVRLRKWLKKWDLVVIGHTHIPFVYKFRKKVVLNPGSVGQPRDRNPKASYAIVDIDESAIDVEIVRLDYDINKTCKTLFEAELNEYLCQRLFKGT
ncbi:MAG: metallophosphoesterase family protein [Candidatus Hodarchaeota archaeon]